MRSSVFPQEARCWLFCRALVPNSTPADLVQEKIRMIDEGHPEKRSTEQREHNVYSLLLRTRQAELRIRPHTRAPFGSTPGRVSSFQSGSLALMIQ